MQPTFNLLILSLTSISFTEMLQQDNTICKPPFFVIHCCGQTGRYGACFVHQELNQERSGWGNNEEPEVLLKHDPQ